MRFLCRKITHFRFEPDVDSGTTYAFEYKTGKLVIGRKKMHRLILAVSETERNLESLLDEFVDPNAQVDFTYTSEKDLMIDIMKLVNANVIEVKG